MSYQQFFRHFFRSAFRQSARTSQQTFTRRINFTLLMAPIAYKLLVINNTPQVSFCAEPPIADRIRGTYENKIRFFSPPEKIFETFASVKTDDGKLVMSYSDFFRALTPYNYSEIRDNKAYFEKFKPDVLKVADSNNDGVISFPEFFFFITILQLPIGLLAKEFAQKDPATMRMNKQQFSKTLTDLRKKTLLGQKQTNKGFIPDARLISAKEEEFLQTNEEIVETLFNGKPYYTLSDFIEFRQKLKTSLRHYEFHQYEVEDENERISAEDFAKSLLVCLPLNQTSKYLKRIHELKLEGEVTFKEFIAFQRFIDDVDSIKEKVLAYRYITIEQLKGLCDEFAAQDPYCKEKGIKITETQIHVLVKLLDLDDNGQLDHDEVIGVLEERQLLGQGRDAELKEAIGNSVKKGFSWIRESLKF